MIAEKPVVNEAEATHRRRLRTLGTGYTWFVRVARMALPLTALVIIGVVGAKMSMDPEQQQASMLPAEEKTAPGEIQITQAKYEGVDAAGRAYTLTADDAKREVTTPHLIQLTQPKADVTLADGQWLMATAKTGLYDNAAATLSLEGDVAVFYEKGYEIHLEAIDLDIKKNQASAAKPLHIQGPGASLDAAGLAVLDLGMRIIFAGPAKLTLRPDSMKEDRPEEKVKG